ncbi:GlmU family protein [uncultured Microscilla sp.]|uniref:GlmU family protein n=1 Tax=uncultured Microscilla sp. TaxID=432653 RepID=UPI00260C618A|nr:GlmU family protein [uncultured Microscilla sp.]
MQYILFDHFGVRNNLKPFTLVRPVACIRVGILTIAQKWEKYLGTQVSFQTEAYLEAKFDAPPLDTLDKYVLIDGSICPDLSLTAAIQQLQPGEALSNSRGEILALHYDKSVFAKDLREAFQPKKLVAYTNEFTRIENLWDIFQQNAAQIQSDFRLITQGRTSTPIADPHTIVYNPQNVFVEEGAQLKACVLNAEKGVIYIGKGAQVSEGSIIQSNFALGDHAVVNPGAKMRGDTTIGPYCKVGGEISNSVFFGYSNKGHDGFLGNSVVGEWCNFGADTNCSNLKNNYGNIKVWNYGVHDYIDSRQQFCGVMMGDHSKAGINTMFNTGTVVGINANVYGAGFPAKFIPSFAWGGADAGFGTYDLQKAFETANLMMQRRGKACDEAEQAILTHVFNHRLTP